jgi:hypothetical protein
MGRRFLFVSRRRAARYRNGDNGGASALIRGRSQRHASERQLRCDRTHAPVWKHTHNPTRRHRGRRQGRTIPRARALRRKAVVRISAVPSSSLLALSPKGKSDVERSRSREKRERAASRAIRLQRNATSHADRHGHDYPSAPAMQHPDGADLTAAVHR